MRLTLPVYTRYTVFIRHAASILHAVTRCTAALIAAVCVCGVLAAPTATGSSPASAPATFPSPPVSPAGSPSVTGVLQVTLALGVVLLAILATAWLMRRLGAGQLGQPGKIRLVGGVAVGPKERVVIVEVQDTWLVLGVTAVEINALHSLPKPVTSEGAERLAADDSFARRLAEQLKRLAPATNSVPGNAAPGNAAPGNEP